MPLPLCRHIKTNGTRCKAPSLTDGHWCYFHHRLHQRHRAFRPTEATRGYLIPGQHIELTALEDRESVQVALSVVIKPSPPDNSISSAPQPCSTASSSPPTTPAASTPSPTPAASSAPSNPPWKASTWSVYHPPGKHPGKHASGKHPSGKQSRLKSKATMKTPTTSKETRTRTTEKMKISPGPRLSC